MILSRSQTTLGIALALTASVALGADIKVTLSGAEENPPVATAPVAKNHVNAIRFPVYFAPY